MSLENRQGGPAGHGAASESIATDEAIVGACRVCGHPIHAPRSIARGIGPVCHRRAGAEEVAA